MDKCRVLASRGWLFSQLVFSMTLKFTPIQKKDAALLLKWRTAPEITRHMYTDLEDPSVAKQEAWIESIQNRTDYRAYMIVDDDTAVGFLCFSDIDFQHSRCSTGSYIYDREARLKYALTLHTYVCNYVFANLKLNKIVNYILDANEKVVKLQRLHKSRLVGCLKQHVFKNGSFHDVQVFEQLQQDWKNQKQHFSLDKIKAAFEDWN